MLNTFVTLSGGVFVYDWSLLEIGSRTRLVSMHAFKDLVIVDRAAVIRLTVAVMPKWGCVTLQVSKA